jgi:hypothetical protein
MLGVGLGSVASGGSKVVTSGLGLWYDIGFRASYPGSGATLYDLANNKNATMYGNYAFNSGNGGYLTDFLLFNSYTLINSSYSVTGLSGLTMQAIFMYTEGQYDGPKIIGSTNNGGNDFGLEVGSGNTIGVVSDGGGRFARATVNQNQWYFVSTTRDVSSLSLSVRVNGGARTTNTYGSLGNVAFTNGWMFSRSGGSSTQFKGRIGAVLFYTRTLTSDEELQNYNFFKSRFSLS